MQGGCGGASSFVRPDDDETKRLSSTSISISHQQVLPTHPECPFPAVPANIQFPPSSFYPPAYLFHASFTSAYIRIAPHSASPLLSIPSRQPCRRPTTMSAPLRSPSMMKKRARGQYGADGRNHPPSGAMPRITANTTAHGDSAQ